MQPPRVTWSDRLLGLGMLLLFIAQAQIPGPLADLSGLVVGGWELGTVSRQTVILLLGYALLGVRGLHPLLKWALALAIFGFNLRIGESRITHDPLTLGFLLLQIAFALVAVRVIIRKPDLRPEGEK